MMFVFFVFTAGTKRFNIYSTGTYIGSWHLPLSPDGGLEPAGSAFYPDDLARRLAAAKLVGNRKAVVPFTLRGVGLPGVPPVMAELADPNARPNKDFAPPVDAALRWKEGGEGPASR